MIAILVASIILLLLLRVPVGFAMMIPSVAYLLLTRQPLSLAVQQMVGGVDSWVLLAIPLFLLVGSVAGAAGIADRMFDVALGFVGHLRGGLAYTNIIASVSFATINGAAIADVAALGPIEHKVMRRNGYSDSFATGLTAASATTGPVLPPSIVAIIYSAVTSVSIGAMFAAAVIPAFLIAFALSAYVWIWTRTRPELKMQRVPWARRWPTLLRSIGAFFAPVIILGGILGGVFTPTEAAGIAALYIVALGFVYRTISLRRVWELFASAATTAGSMMIMIAGGALLTVVLVRENVPQLASDLVTGFTDNAVVFLIVVNILLLLAGMVLDTGAAILIFVPILLPIAVEFGVNPIQFGVVVILNLMLGLITPPVGIVLYVLSSATNVPVTEVIKGVLPFYLPLLVCLVLVTFVPELSMWLPQLFGFV